MEESLVIEKLRKDSRNKTYTGRGIGPIFQLNPKSKILIIGQAPGKKGGRNWDFV
jgi:uracil-DNA glycosylase